MKHDREKIIMYITIAFGLLISQRHNDANFHQMLSNGIRYLEINIGREKDV